MAEPEQKKSTFLGLTQSSIISILTCAFMVGVAWAKLNAVEVAIRDIGDKIGSVSKSQMELQKDQMELQLNEKLIEARVLILEQQQAPSKHR